MFFGEILITCDNAEWILDKNLEPEFDRDDHKFRLKCQLKTLAHQVNSQVNF